MSDYISREAVLSYPLRRDMCDRKHANRKFMSGVESVMEYVEDMPAADVASVVHCRDCENLELSGCYGVCRRGHLGMVKPWDYCSRGVRRDRKEQGDA